MKTNAPFELVCGMEIHAELKTASKMFCSCKNDPFHAKEPNSHTCPVCLGLPGALPVANKKAIEWTIQLGLALGCKINRFSKFDRKHYFYPDLPKAYQISQYDIPFCYEGSVDTSEGPVRITRIHLEEDTGKLLHKKVNGKEVSLIDFNRSSVPLIEIVTEPDIKSAAQAAEFGRIIRDTIRFLEIGDCDMEQGGMRLEANVSVRPRGQKDLPPFKTELKNINSFRFMEQAIEYEITRQSELLKRGETPKQETRGWNQTTQATFSQRSKEEAEDYRYFPDPDIPPIALSQAEVDSLAAAVPQPKNTIIEKWNVSYGVEPRYSARLLVTKSDVPLWEEVFAQAKKREVSPNKLVAAYINKHIVPKNLDASYLLDAYLKLTATDSLDESETTTIIAEVLANNPDIIEKYQAGQHQIIGFLIGQVMQKLSSKPDPKELRSLIEKTLQNQ